MHARRTGRTAEPPTIEGEAVVIGRRPGAAARPEATPTNDNRQPDREAPPIRHRPRPFRPDLVFPGAVRRSVTPLRLRDRLFAAEPRTVATAGASLAALAVVAGLLAIDAARPPVPATPAPAFTLAETRGTIVSRPGGAVLAVEGSIRNLSDGARAVPALVVRVPGSSGFTRVVRTSERPLGPGRSLFFHSTLAVPLATTADGIGVTLAGTDWRRP